MRFSIVNNHLFGTNKLTDATTEYRYEINNSHKATVLNYNKLHTLGMDYRKGSIGRLFVVRIDHGEDLLGELTGLAVKEDIKAGYFIMLGAMGRAELVTGPREKVVPPAPVWHGFDDAREVIGVGNIFWENGKTKIHLHGAAGNSENLTMGCIRGKTEVFMVVEVMIIEMDIPAERVMDEAVGYSGLTFKKQTNPN